jgi:hypothetical protein
MDDDLDKPNTKPTKPSTNAQQPDTNVKHHSSLHQPPPPLRASRAMSDFAADQSDNAGDLSDERCVGPANQRTVVATGLNAKMSIPDVCKAVEQAGSIHVAYRVDAESVRVEFFQKSSADAALLLPPPVIMDVAVDLHQLVDEETNVAGEVEMEG